MTETYLSHHGIKGQKWGVRRFQNPDGTLTSAGKARRSEVGEKKSGINKETLKKVGKAVLITGSVAAAAYVYANNADAVNAAIGTLATKAVDKSGLLSSIATDAVSDGLGNTLVTLGKDYVGKAAKAGMEAALKETKAAGGKVIRGAVQGAAIIATTKMLEAAAGKEAVAFVTQAYNAYNKKNKIGRVPSIEDLFKGNSDTKEDDDDE